MEPLSALTKLKFDVFAALQGCVLLVTFWTLSCASPMVQIKSNPDGAEVFLRRDSEVAKKIGVTPFSDFSSSLGIQGATTIQFEVKKPGFNQQTFVLPGSRFQTALNMSIDLESLSKDQAQCSESTQKMNEVAMTTAEILSLIQSKKFDRALTLTEAMMRDYPSVPVFQDLAGNIRYLQGDIAVALEHYLESQRLAPNNAKTERMIEKLKSIGGTRIPASSGGGQ